MFRKLVRNSSVILQRFCRLWMNGLTTRALNCLIHRKLIVLYSSSQKNPCYLQFKKHLEKDGFLVYPREFDCGNSDHPLVDVAARMGSFYWAFEYKSRNDSIQRGVDQLKCYSRWFDFVVLVSEKPVRHTHSKHYWSLWSLGAGIWNYFPAIDKCVMQKNPSIQSPLSARRKLVARRFKQLERKKSDACTSEYLL